ncbi:enoyl-CoA hydratase/isomerase family protein [Tardiphaga sp. vice154]|nr:enoyl-CoA hydratase/isomerase family protein [Tardiphaga sp. vice154]
MILLSPRSRFENHSGESKPERRPGPGGHGQLRARFAELMRTLNRFEALEIPITAAVQGHCPGGVLEWAARADVLFASESARFGHPEQTLGLMTLLGGVYRVAACAGRAKAMEWAQTSELATAREMARYGVVNRLDADRGQSSALENLVMLRRSTSAFNDFDQKVRLPPPFRRAYVDQSCSNRLLPQKSRVFPTRSSAAAFDEIERSSPKLRKSQT